MSVRDEGGLADVDRSRRADVLARFDEAFVQPETPRPADKPATFEERALSRPPSPLDRIDHLFHQTPKRVWWGVLALAVLVGAGVVWAVVTDRIVTAQSQAIILPPAGLFTVSSPQAGQVGDVEAVVGDRVGRGDVLAELNVPGAADVVALTSPVDGTVVVVGVRAGEVTSPGNALFVVAPAGPDVVAIGLFPAGAVSAVAPGQSASVSVNGVAPDRYGRVEGHVASVGDIPLAASRLLQLTGDPTLVGSLSQQGPLYEVIVELERADTPSGVAWTRGDGPPQPIPIGALAVVSIEVEREALIEKVLD
jgi:multidrug efflux pump subunit AcrA (membrane-fusion protein)